ncbi:MAG: hypothetical protein ACI865_003317 [Flavobacteriaceae bacterium]|jgi:hypothetical protein
MRSYLFITIIFLSLVSCEKDRISFSGQYVCSGERDDDNVITLIANDTISVDHDGTVIHYSAWNLNHDSGNTFAYSIGDAIYDYSITMTFENDSLFYTLYRRDDFGTPWISVTTLKGRRI